MKKPLWLVAWLLVIEVLVILLLIPGDWINKTIQRELELMEKNLGYETRQWISNTAGDWYKTSMLDSGFYDAIYRTLIPTEDERKKSKGMEDMGQIWFAWVEGRIKSFTNVIYQFYMRLALLYSWAPYLLILFIPAVYDGLMSWKIKRTNFDYASPVVHRYSIRGALFLGVGLFIAFFAPIALNPMVIPVAMMLCCVLLGLALSNVQKRI